MKAALRPELHTSRRIYGIYSRILLYTAMAPPALSASLILHDLLKGGLPEDQALVPKLSVLAAVGLGSAAASYQMAKKTLGRWKTDEILGQARIQALLPISNRVEIIKEACRIDGAFRHTVKNTLKFTAGVQTGLLAFGAYPFRGIDDKPFVIAAIGIAIYGLISVSAATYLDAKERIGSERAMELLNRGRKQE